MSSHRASSSPQAERDDDPGVVAAAGHPRWSHPTSKETAKDSFLTLSRELVSLVFRTFFTYIL